MADPDDAAKDGKKYQAANDDGESYEDFFVVINPALYLTSNSAAFTLAVFALPSSSTWSSIQEVLLHGVTHVRPEFRRRTRNSARLRVAGIGVVVGSIAAHDCLALQVSTGALTRRTLQSLAICTTVGAIGFGRVWRTCAVVSRAGLGRITLACRSSADSAFGGELAGGCATAVVAWITNSARFIFASCGIATLIAGTAFDAPTITVLSSFNNAVATLLAGDCGHTSVIRKAAALNGVPS